jgi:hypothetical protein
MKTKIKIKKTKENVVLTIPIDVFEELFPPFPEEKSVEPVEPVVPTSTLTGEPISPLTQIDSTNGNPVINPIIVG